MVRGEAVRVSMLAVSCLHSEGGPGFARRGRAYHEPIMGSVGEAKTFYPFSYKRGAKS